MPRNKMDDLRNHLFEVIERLKDGDIDVNTSKAINDAAGRIIDSAKVEVQYRTMLAREGYSPLSESPLLSTSKPQDIDQGEAPGSSG